MALGQDPLDALEIPDGTTVEEHDLVTDGDIVVGGQSTVEFGVRGRNVLAGERVTFGGDIEAEGDCRLDVWCDVAGNVLVGDDAYLGERVHIGGRLMVSGDLDIGDDVDIEEGFEANGWIVIRNPVPTLVFYFLVLSQLLSIGENEAADELADALSGDSDEEPLVIPRGSTVSDDAWQVSTPATVGDGCRLHGNLRAETIVVGCDDNVFGSLRARDDIEIGEDTQVHGDVTTRDGTVTIADGAHVRGDISCSALELHDGAEVDGTIRASGDIRLIQPDPDAGDAGGSGGDTSAAADATSDAPPTDAADAEADTETDPATDAETGSTPEDTGSGPTSAAEPDPEAVPDPAGDSAPE
ncbi:polymer-forming cytoskeletal protein [Halobellus sp. MBLA0160]|uniref:Polymer-forming cytoskeletal protein n=1 Tax=Halobellus ruber TaxID=2761102 RepID=A0A7J9SGC4_9EURY|nr:polymer-forming cytoskeletal protein [Halobellus ruber]